MKEFVYADNAATTKLSPVALEAMTPYLSEEYGNPSSLSAIGRRARRCIEDARKQVASLIGASPAEIYFTSGGTEADNWAIKGLMRKARAKGKNHLITTSIEHHAVLHSAQALQREGFDVTYLPVDSKGLVSPADVKAAITTNTALVSVMFANNELGTIEPAAEIGALCREVGVPFHTDAVQAVGTLPINVSDMNIDMMSLSAHKFYGPKYVGALYCRRELYPDSILHGGAQEKGRRPGTENPALIAGLSAALTEACAEMQTKTTRIAVLRDAMQRGIEEIEGARVNGDISNRLPGHLNVSFDGLDGESLLFSLDLKGIAASSGSACASGSVDPSHVLIAIGLPYAKAHGSLRLTLGKYNTEEEVARIVSAVKETVAELRKK